MGAYEDYLAQLAGATTPGAAYPSAPEPSYYESYLSPILGEVSDAFHATVGYPYRKLGEMGQRFGLEQAGPEPNFGADLLKTAGEAVAETLYPDVETPRYVSPDEFPVLSRVKAVADPLAAAAMQMVADPAMVALGPLGQAGKVGKVAGKLIGAAFVPGMTAGALESGGRAVEAARDPELGVTSPEALGAATEALTQGGFAALGAKHALGREKPAKPTPEAAPVEPESVTRFATTPPGPNKLGFYSQLERVVSQLPQPMRGADMARYLSDPKRGVKAEEMKWTGLDDFLKGKAGERVTPQEVREFVAQNKVEVKDVVKGEGKRIGTNMQGEPIYAYGDSAEGSTKFNRPDLTTPGGENYRELLLTLPEHPAVERAKELAKKKELTPDEIDWLRNANAHAQEYPRAFTGGHFDEPNVLAHVRLNERTDAEGKRVLFIEEVQSDWAQKGRKEGFALPSEQTAPMDSEYRALVHKNAAARDAGREPAPADIARAQELEDALMRSDRSKIPSAPFVGNTSDWSSLAMKRMIRYAAENGFDRVAWTTGDMQVNRYNEALRKSVDSVDWTRTKDGVHLVGFKEGRKVVDTVEKETALSDAIGKAMADKIRADSSPGGTFEGADLAISDTGMAGFYDKILPAVAGKLGKKFGAKVGETEIPTGRLRTMEDDINTIRFPGGEKLKAHSLDITPEMRASVTKEGFPQFAASERPPTARDTSTSAPTTPLTYDSVQRALPGLDIIDTADGNFTAHLRDGRTLRVSSVGEIELGPPDSPASLALAASAEAGGIPSDTPARATGSYQRIGRDSIIRIAKDAGAEVPDHEGFHFFYDLALTPKEKAALLKQYGNEEAAAYAYAKWQPTTQVNSWFSKILAYAKRIYHSFRPTWESTFAGVREGRAGERVAGERGVLPAAELLDAPTPKFATEPTGPPSPPDTPERLTALPMDAAELDAAATGAQPPPRPPVESEYAAASRALIEGMRPPIPRTPPASAPATFERGGVGERGRPGGREGEPADIAPDIGLNLEKMADWDPELKGRVSEVMQEANSRLRRGEVQHWADVDPAVDRIFNTTSPEELVARLNRRGGLPSQAEMKAMRIGAETFWRDTDTKYRAWKQDPGNRALEAEYVKSNLHATAFEMYTTDQKTSAARLLQSLREVIPAGKDASEFDIGRLARALRKRGVSERDADALLRIYRESPSEFAPALKLAFEPAWRDKLMYAYRAHLLSGAPTTWANALGNTGSLAANSMETAFAGIAESVESGKRQLMGRGAIPLAERQRFVSDASSQARAIASEFPTALKELWRDIRDITPGFLPKGGAKEAAGQSRFDIREVPISIDKILEHKAGPTGHNPLSRTYWKAAGRAYQKLAVWDDFFGKLITAGEWGKIANREARRRGHQGTAAAEYAQRWLQDNKRTGVHAEHVAKEVDRQLYRLDLTSDRGVVVALGGWAQDLTRRLPLTQIVAPFVRTPTNVLDMTLRFTPKGMFVEMRNWGKNERALKELDAKRSAKDSKLSDAEYAESRQKLIDARGEMLDRAGASLAGSMVMLPAFYAMASSGFLTGSGPKDQREKQLLLSTGWRPYSLHVGDTYLPLNRLEPIGTLLGYTADLYEMKEGGKEGGISYENLLGMFVENAKDKPFLVGLSNFFEFMQSPSKTLDKITTRTLGSVVPMGVAKVAQAYDPVIRDTSGDTILEKIANTLQSRIPGASTNLPARLTATGKEAHRGGEGVTGATSRLLSPVQYATEEEGSSVEREMLRVGYTPSLPRRDMRLPGGTRLRLSTRDYRTLLGSYDDAAAEVSRLIGTRAYQGAPDTIEEAGGNSKEGMIKRIYDRYREEARMKLYADLQKRRAIPRAGGFGAVR